jgi:hypothetical protein
MKISICISGFIRTWEYTKYSFINTLCKDIKPDIFIHTYRQNYFEFSSNREDIFYSESDIRDMFKDFNIKGLIIEDRDDFLPLLIEQNNKYLECKNNTYSIAESSDNLSKSVLVGLRILDQIRSIEKCFNLKTKYEQENNFKYDFVVKTRFDVLYLSSPNWNVITKKNIFTETGGTGGYPHDHVTFGTNDDMDEYSKRYSRIDELIKIYKIDMCAHNTFRVICEINNITIHPGIIYSVLLRNENEFHKLWEGTVHINTLTDINLKHTIIKNMFPNKVTFEDDMLDIDTNKNSVIVAITSMIYLKDNYKLMSKYSPEERLNQVINTILSVKEKIPNSIIVLLEGSNISTHELSKVYTLVDKIILFDSDDSKKYLYNYNKSYGEVYKLLHFAQKIEKLSFNKFIKISGRYQLNSNFNIDNFTTDICGTFCNDGYDNECFLTVLYSVHKDTFKEYIDLFSYLKNDNIKYDIEHSMSESGIKINKIDKIGVQGYIYNSLEIVEW